MSYYILDADHRPRIVDMIAWSKFFGDMDNRRVGYTELGEGVHVSTVFLGMDHNWGSGPPILFESMVFEGPWDQHCWRYATWDAAEAGHQQIVSALESGADLGSLDPATGGES